MRGQADNNDGQGYPADGQLRVPGTCTASAACWAVANALCASGVGSSRARARAESRRVEAMSVCAEGRCSVMAM